MQHVTTPTESLPANRPTPPPRAAPTAKPVPQMASDALRRGQVGRFYLLYMLGALFPLSMGLALYGWRGTAVIATVVASALLTAFVWRRIGRRGAALHLSHVIWLSLLLGMMLPAHLALRTSTNGGGVLHNGWAVAAGAGVLLVVACWLFGGVGYSRIQPLVVTYLTVMLVFHAMLPPRLVLHKTHAIVGDLDDHDLRGHQPPDAWVFSRDSPKRAARSEEHTSELQSLAYLVCRLLLE